MESKVYTSRNPEETRNLARKLSQKIKGGDVLCLYGELGSGKTTFTQGLSFGLGIKKRITSPTFVLLREYDLPDGKKLYHLDCYRLEKEDEAKNLGLIELMENNNILVIEWAEKIKNILPRKRIDIYFKNIGEEKREIKIITQNSKSHKFRCHCDPERTK